MKQMTVLIADDDKAICTVLERAFQRQGYETHITDNGRQLQKWVESGKGDVAITDVLMPGGNGLDALANIKISRPELPVIVISAQNTLMTAVRASQLGAYEYLPKPFDLDQLISCVEKAASQQVRKDSQEDAGDDISESERLGDAHIIGRSPAMQAIYRTLGKMVNVDLTVMITGESGTGKELVARALHVLGPRKDKEFVALNMAAIPRELVESELFGHEKGSFTGAVARKSGAFELAQGGTLFLDEIGDMPIEAQTRLLRVLQQGEFMTVGGLKPIAADARIICATHRDPAGLVKQKQFREDLFYRLNVVPVKLPPLRERREDIPELVQYFLNKAKVRGLPAKEITAAGMNILEGYAWPGNVRELENLIYRMVTLYSQRVIDAPSLQTELSSRKPPAFRSMEKPLPEVIREHVENYFASHENSLPLPGIYDRLMPLVEKPLIEVTLKATDGNQVKAAEILGINRNTLRKKIAELGIEPWDKQSRKPT